MLDTKMRAMINSPLDQMGEYLSRARFSANAMTGFGFFLGCIACTLLSMGFGMWASVFFICNRMADGLDGAIARVNGLTDFGGFLDIVLDFIIYAGMVFAFAVSHADIALYASFLLLSFIPPMVTFLAFATIAAERKWQTQAQGKKSFYYLGGLCEGTETIIFLLMMCWFPGYFVYFSITFGLMCWLTAAGRMYEVHLMTRCIS